MGVIKIDYSEINSAAKKAKEAAAYFEDFAADIEKKVIKKMDELTGYDSSGNIANARSIISNKVRELRGKKDYYTSISSNLEVLADNFENREAQVVTNVTNIATEAFELKEQSKWKSFTQWVYGTFCVDLVNWNPITRAIGNCIKTGMDWVYEQGSKVVNWFKHGEGKYVLGIVLDVLAVVGAVVATIGAIALAVATEGAATPLVVAAVASTVGTIMTLADSIVSVGNKYKAYRIEKDSADPGRARFYGEIGGVRDSINKTDFGDQKANNVMEGVGIAYDVTHTVADVTATVAGSIGAAGLTNKTVIDPVTNKHKLDVVYDSSLIKTNFKKRMLDKIGLKKIEGKWKFNIKKLLSMKEIKFGAVAKEDLLSKHLIDEVIGKKTWKVIRVIGDVSKYPSKIIDRKTNIDTIVDKDTSIYDKIKSVLKYTGDSKLNISKPVSDFNDTILKIIESVEALTS